MAQWSSSESNYFKEAMIQPRQVWIQVWVSLKLLSF